MSWPALMDSTFSVARKRLGGEDVVYAPKAGQPVTVRGIFDAAYVHVEVGTNGVDSVGPAVCLAIAELPVDPKSDDPRLTIGGKIYRMRSAHPDGQGLVRLLLLLVA